MSELFSLFTLCFNNTVDTRNGFLGHWWQLIGVVVNQPEIPKLSCPLGARNWDKAHILCIVQVLGSLLVYASIVTMESLDDPVTENMLCELGEQVDLFSYLLRK